MKLDEEIQNVAFYSEPAGWNLDCTQVPPRCPCIRVEEAPCQTCTPRGLKVSGVPSSSSPPTHAVCRVGSKCEDKKHKAAGTVSALRLWVSEIFLPFLPRPHLHIIPHTHTYTYAHTHRHVLTQPTLSHAPPYETLTCHFTLSTWINRIRVTCCRIHIPGFK